MSFNSFTASSIMCGLNLKQFMFHLGKIRKNLFGKEQALSKNTWKETV